MEMSIRKGSVMVMALVLTFIIVIFVGAIGSYYVNTARLANWYLEDCMASRDEVLWNAMELLNQAVLDVSSEFSTSDITENDTIEKAIKAAQTKINGQSFFSSSDLDIRFETQVIDHTLKVRASYYKGNEVVAAIEEIIEFYYGGSQTVQRLPYIFDFIYFVDNFGHLESTSIVANGDVHANDKFVVTGPTINGFVSAASNVVEVTDGKIWTDKKYAVEIKTRYAPAVRTPVRPTNPIAGVSWSYGYEAPLSINPYTFTNQPPEVVEKPDKDLVEPEFPDPGETRPADPRPFSEPPTEITERTESTETTVTKWKYVYYRYTYYTYAYYTYAYWTYTYWKYAYWTHTYWQHVYYTNSKKNNNYYDSEEKAKKADSKGTVTKNTDYYNSEDEAKKGKKNKSNKGTVSKGEDKYGTKADAESAKRTKSGKGSIAETSTSYSTKNEANAAKRNNGNKGTVSETSTVYNTENEANAAKRNNGNIGSITSISTVYNTQSEADTAKRNNGGNGTVAEKSFVYSTQNDANTAKSNNGGKGTVAASSTVYNTQADATTAMNNKGGKGVITEVVELFDTEREANQAKSLNNNKGSISSYTETETVETKVYVYDGVSYSTSAEAENARTVARNLYNQKVTQLEDYEKYPERRQDWLDYYDLQRRWSEYNAYLTNKATYDASYAVFTNNVTAWMQTRDTDGLVTDLDSAVTTNSSGRLVRFVQDHVDYKPMLSVSDTASYQQLCADQKGTLKCDNAYQDGTTKKTIVWKNKRQQDVMELWEHHRSKLYGRITGWSRYGAWSDSKMDEGDGVIRDYFQHFGSNPYTQPSPHPLRRELADVSITGDGSAKTQGPFKNANAYTCANASFACETAYISSGHDVVNVTYPSIPTAVQKLEESSVVLIGTDSNPIYISNCVYVAGDVIIRGKVSGRGTIYSGRNIHIVGDIVYENPPKWPYDDSGLAGSTASARTSAKAEILAANKTRDLLLLSARGNIVIGDYTSTAWTNQANMQAIANLARTSSQYGDSYSDDAIGYGNSFKANRDYKALDGGFKVDFNEIDVTNYKQRGHRYAQSTYSDREWELSILSLKYIYEWVEEIYYYAPTMTVPNTANRKFYESILGDEVISGLKQVSGAEADEAWQLRPGENILGSENADSGDITHIDAVLFANHAILGVVGGTTSHQFVLNGAMACRDEALFASFDRRFSQHSDRKIWLNWDMRVKSDDLTDWVPEHELVKITMGGGSVTNRIVSWQQVK